MADLERVTVLLPAYNEAATIAEVVAGFRDAGFDDVLVVDGDSDDETRALASDAGARVEVQSGRGKGQAVREGVTEHVDREYVLMADGDGTYRPADAERMLAPLFAGEAEHVIGDRFAAMEDGAMTRFNRVGNAVFNWLFRNIHGEDLQDILSGYRAFTRQSFERLHLSAPGFGIETEMSVACVEHGVRTTVVPITYCARPDSSSSNLHPVKDGGIILLAIYRQAKTSNPLFYFGSVGSLSTAFGVVLGAYVGYEWVFDGVSHEVLAVVSALGIIFGVQLLMFGVLSDLLLDLHHEQLDRIEDLRAGRED